ncbi:LytTR family DNA-binding domain-containing protein [Lysinibacillus sp. KU-BSD001]|uniref:LytTR family DNA-binding domain-containing protein n=1 Tax=Lysinibacillus sp. KU-BSD001 TaxID=3141328 RepID=UPI0036E8BD80
MKVTIDIVSEGENEIIIKCQQLDEEIEALLQLIEESVNKLIVNREGEMIFLQPNEIFFVEAVDNKIFVYTEDAVCQSQESLYNLETMYSHMGLVRIGKSQLVNLHHIKKLKSIMNSRIEITLESGDRLVVSRHYARAFKSRLGLEH